MTRKPGARLGDLGSEHDGYPPTPIVSGSDITCNGRRIARQGDSLVPHTRARSSPHPRSVAGGAGSVLINGRPWARQGDPIDCGGAIVAGSADVLVGDAPANRNPVQPAEWDAVVRRLATPEERPESERDRSRLAAQVAVAYRGTEGAVATWHAHYRRLVNREEPPPLADAVTEPAERAGLERALAEHDREAEAVAAANTVPDGDEQ